MTAKAATDGDLAAQTRMTVLRVLADMTGQAAATAVRRRIDRMRFFRLPEVAAGALLAQQRVGNRMSQGLEVLCVRRPGIAIDDLPGAVNDARSGVHQTVLHRLDHVRMTATAALPGVVEVAGKGDQPGVSERLFPGAGIAGVTACAGSGCKRMRGSKTGLLAGMAAQTAMHRWLGGDASGNTHCDIKQKTTKSHSGRVTDVLHDAEAPAKDRTGCRLLLANAHERAR